MLIKGKKDEIIILEAEKLKQNNMKEAKFNNSLKRSLQQNSKGKKDN